MTLTLFCLNIYFAGVLLNIHLVCFEIAILHLYISLEYFKQIYRFIYVHGLVLFEFECIAVGQNNVADEVSTKVLLKKSIKFNFQLLVSNN